MMEVDMMLMDDSMFVGIEGILSHLKDSDEDIVETTVDSLLASLDDNWAQVADHLPLIEELSERGLTFSAKASLLAAQVFFHLQQYELALAQALRAGDLFRIDDGSDFSQKLIEQCIDSYREFAQARYAFDKGVSAEEPKPLSDDRLVAIVERMLDQCYLAGDFRHAVGIAVECRRLDHVERAIDECPDTAQLLDHCFYLCEAVISSRIFRDEVLTLIVRLYVDLDIPNYTNICRSYFYLAKPMEISRILWKLAKEGSERSLLLAFQVAFDLSEYQNERFQSAIYNFLPKPSSQATPATAGPSSSSSDATSGSDATATAGDASQPASSDAASASATSAMDVAASATPAVSVPSDLKMGPGEWTSELTDTQSKLKSILLGEKVIPLELDFLFRKSATDFLLMKTIKDNINERDSVLNNAIVLCNGIMNSGTTIDAFLRDNLDWWATAAHWAKFSNVASLGMVHFHHLSSSRTILERYLPSGGARGGPGGGSSPYQEGGALYALGLMHCGDNSADTSSEVRAYLLQELNKASNEILQHGGCLGLGLAALGSQEPAFLGQVKEILYHDRAVPGEAAGIALGLLLCGGAGEAAAMGVGELKSEEDEDDDDGGLGGDQSLQRQWFDEMLSYAHETQHEKIVRGLVMGISIMYYDFEERADDVIDQLIKDDSSVIRYGGCFTVGMAYACSGNNKAVSLLLHLAVSDVSDDVRRAAVLNIGFVLANKPSAVPRVVELLSNSYNSHVRYGAAAAMGIACAGTGDVRAIKLLQRMYNEDSVDFVKQCSLISLGMVMQEQNEKENPQVKQVTEEVFMKSIKQKRKRKHDMTIMGAIYGLGIMNAAGRNAVISLCGAGAKSAVPSSSSSTTGSSDSASLSSSSSSDSSSVNSPSKQKRMNAIIGLCLFWQHWYWYPLIPMITLALKPTFIMALNKDLRMPQIEFKSNANSELFKYPESLREEDLQKKVENKQAVLSITAKTKARALQRAKSRAAAAGDDVEMSDKSAEESSASNEKKSSDVEMKDSSSSSAESKEDDGSSSPSATEKKAKAFDMLANPSRVTLAQQRVMNWTDSRFRPVRGLNNGGKPLSGVIMVEDSKPEEALDLVEEAELDTGGVHGNEPKPPKPFRYEGP